MLTAWGDEEMLGLQGMLLLQRSLPAGGVANSQAGVHLQTHHSHFAGINSRKCCEGAPVTGATERAAAERAAAERAAAERAAAERVDSPQWPSGRSTRE
jgi:hypothetical protein